MSSIFVIRLKNNGKIFSRHYKANSGKQAASYIQGKGRILSVRKMHSEDIVGTIKSMKLDDITGTRRENVISDETTIEDIVFSKPAQKKRIKRRFNNGQRRNQEE